MKIQTLIKVGNNNIGQYKPPAEPDREFVERAIVEVLEIAQSQGITAANFIQMLDSGMRTSDFLTAMDAFTNADHTIYSTPTLNKEMSS